MIDYATVRDAVVRRLASDIRIEVKSWGLPYQASLSLAHPNLTHPGHPWELVVWARTPELAVQELLIVLDAWFTDPLGATVSDSKRENCQIFVQRRSVDAPSKKVSR